jgi:hypothetical protein
MHTTAIPCGYAVEGLGFYFIPVTENPKVNLEEKSAVVRVLEGSLTADQLAVELEKLLPGKNKWVIEEKGTDAFITNFPSSDLLDTTGRPARSVDRSRHTVRGPLAPCQ